MEFKDYYASLGVSADADEKTIKKAYQKLAKKYHPDVNPGDKAAEDKFKEATEAYEAIGDPEKRKKYDELREDYQRWQAHGGRANQGGQWQSYSSGGGGFQAHTMTPEEFADLFGGSRGTSGFGGMEGEDFSDFFYTLFGGVGGEGRSFGRGSVRTRPRAGQDLEVEVNVSLEESYHGTKRMIHTEDKQIEAKIPKGVRTGSKVRLSGQGGPGAAGGPNGNLYLIINVAPDAQYIREGDNLKAKLPVDFYKAVLGGEVSIKTFSGEVILKVPPLSQSGKKFRLKGKGMPKLEKPSQYGDLLAELSIVLPEGMGEQEIAALRDLAEKRKAVYK